MYTEAMTSVNVKQAVPFLEVRDIQASLRFYTGGLGFDVMSQWPPEGRIRWCRLQLGGAAIMLQERWRDDERTGALEGVPGEGVSIHFMCADALAVHRDAASRGVATSRPYVGHGMWVVAVCDPDGYQSYFESRTDVAEGTVLEE
jgi:lactoylglutathione lyase